MKNRTVADIFNEIADILDIKGENPFRIRAYRRAALNIEGLSKGIEEMSGEEVRRIPGIGEDLAGKIDEIVKTGKLNDLDKLRGTSPKGLSVLLKVPGLGPKTAKLISERLGISNIEELEKAVIDHRLRDLPGIREKTEEKILKGVRMLKKGMERRPLGNVLPMANDLIRHLEQESHTKKVFLAGSLRRRKETIKDIDILCTSSDPKRTMNDFVNLPHVKEVLMKGPTKSSVVLEDNIQVDLRVIEDEALGAAMAYFTGSKAHNIRIREMAVKAGLKLNEYGVFRVRDGKKTGGRNEEEVYKSVGLPYIPPELREDTGEIEAAKEGKLPKLIETEDIKGDLHVHTNRSDGRHTLEELVDGARKRGYEYIAITDHSKGLGIAGGLSEKEMLEEMADIDALNKKLRGFRILKGVEVDIKSDMSLDYEDELLKKFDIVVASIHSGFGQPKEKITSRMLAAVENPHVSLIAHPTGRLIGERDPYDIDLTEVMKAAAKNGTALEINSYPKRLDLNDSDARAARDFGVPIVINTDTHLIDQLDYISYGVSTARRAWLEKKDVLNTLPVGRLLKRLKKASI